MEQFGTLVISVWCYTFLHRTQNLISSRRVVQRIRCIRRSEAQEIVNIYKSRRVDDPQMQFDFQPDAESLDYSTADR